MKWLTAKFTTYMTVTNSVNGVFECVYAGIAVIETNCPGGHGQ